MSEEITGGCYCGKIAYKATPPILYQAYCHCDNCRKAVGAQTVAWISVQTSNFEYTKGEPKSYTTETSAVRSFCPDCGTSLTYFHPDKPKHLDITIGSLDDPDSFPPTRDVFPEERLEWVPSSAHNLT